MVHIPRGAARVPQPACRRLGEQLHLACKSLAALPESLGQLQALTELSLNYCSSLAALPESLGQLRALTKLYLNGCSFLTALPESADQLQAARRPAPLQIPRGAARVPRPAAGAGEWEG